MKLVSAILILFFAGWSVANATSASGLLTMKVIRALFLEAKQPLVFTPAVAGSESFRVNPGDSQSGQFRVRGEPGTAYQIRLPDQVVMTTNSGQLEAQQIKVKEFASVPESAGTLDSQGEQIIFVGATRDSLLSNQEEGSYTGTYTVEVIY